jgi:hypothetical protein
MTGLVEAGACAESLEDDRLPLSDEAGELESSDDMREIALEL